MMNIKTIYFLGILAFLLPLAGLSQYAHPDAGFVFDDSTVPRVDIEIDPFFLEFILNPINQESNTEYPATFYFTRGGEIDTVEKVGFRLRGNTSRASAKKSFKISFNTEVKGQKYKGLEKMNLNGEHNDPSVMRAKTCWDLYTSVGIPGARANHVEFYINGDYRGLYLNVEHIDEQFLKKRFSSNDGNLYKCLYPANLVYKGDSPDLYKENIFGRRAYQLQTNREEDDYSDLAHFISVLNNNDVADFQCELESVFDVDLYLKAIVMDILSSNWDGPIVNQNNFYLYHDPASDRFVYLPYDLDNTLGIGWGSTLWWESDIYQWADTWGNAQRPLYKHIIAVPEYRNKISYYFEHYTSGLFTTEEIGPYLDQFAELIAPFREKDEYASLDYGWSFEAFEKSFNQGVANHDKLGLKPYIAQRSASVREQLDLKDPLALLDYHNFDREAQQILFEIKVEFPWDLQGEVALHYQINQDEWKNKSLVSVDGSIFTASVPHDGIGEIKYYYEVNNFTGTLRVPECDFLTIPLGFDTDGLPVINEIMASNRSTIMDEAGEFEDWIELYHAGDTDLNLNDFYLSDNPDNPGKWQLEGDILAAGSYYTVWADEDGEQGDGHANFKLSKDGEYLGFYILQDGVYFVIDSLTFPAQETDISYGRLPNGSGPFQVLPFSSFGNNNESSSSIGESFSEANIDLYPNPSNGALHVSLDEGISQIEIYNSYGQKVLSEAFLLQSKVSLDLSLQNGTYFIKVTNGKGATQTTKFVCVSY